jgi:hypothetical protein
LTAETDPVFSSSDASSITATDITNLGNLSGTNTGDQDLSGLVPYTGGTSDLDLTGYSGTFGGSSYQAILGDDGNSRAGYFTNNNGMTGTFLDSGRSVFSWDVTSFWGGVLGGSGGAGYFYDNNGGYAYLADGTVAGYFADSNSNYLYLADGYNAIQAYGNIYMQEPSGGTFDLQGQTLTISYANISSNGSAVFASGSGYDVNLGNQWGSGYSIEAYNGIKVSSGIMSAPVYETNGLYGGGVAYLGGYYTGTEAGWFSDSGYTTTVLLTDGTDAINSVGNVKMQGLSSGAGAPATILTNFNLYVDTNTGIVYVD